MSSLPPANCEMAVTNNTRISEILLTKWMWQICNLQYSSLHLFDCIMAFSFSSHTDARCPFKEKTKHSRRATR